MQLAQQLCSLFHPLVEVAVYRAPEQEPVKIYNSLSTHALRLDELPTGFGTTLRRLRDGRQVRSVRLHLGGADELLVTLDLDPFSKLSALFAGSEPAGDPVIPGRDQIQLLIDGYLQQQACTREALTRPQKRELINQLYKRGLFDVKDASVMIAELLRTSRATVYNYLTEAKMRLSVHVHQVDTFTDEPFHGNPAGVVLDAQALDDDTMSKIAREMNLSETAFVLPSDSADFRLRYFTRSGQEVRFCGHSTVGALYMIAHQEQFGVSGPGRYAFRIDTGVGVVSVWVTVERDDTIIVSFDAPRIELRPMEVTHADLAAVLGTDVDAFVKKLPVEVENTNRIALAGVCGLKNLLRIDPDMRALTAWCQTHDVIAVCLATTETDDSSHHAQCRVFCPAVGIPEDPFTGAIQGGLAAYLQKSGFLSEQQTVFCFEQGQAMGRPGTVRIELHHGRDGYAARIFAQAVHFFSTEIKLT